MIVALSFLLVGCAPKPEGAVLGECSDGSDNDSNGQTDCEDPNCTGKLACGGSAFELCINELMASNAMTITDESGAFPDWIELANLSDEDIDLDGYSITDNLDDPSKHVLGDVVLPANGFVLLWADGDTDQGDQHLGFQLDKSGEQIGLFQSSGAGIDLLDYDDQATDWSAARSEDCSSEWIIDTTPTPESTNE
jgi:large repetitive protein